MGMAEAQRVIELIPGNNSYCITNLPPLVIGGNIPELLPPSKSQYKKYDVLPVYGNRLIKRLDFGFYKGL